MITRNQFIISCFLKKNDEKLKKEWKETKTTRECQNFISQKLKK